METRHHERSPHQNQATPPPPRPDTTQRRQKDRHAAIREPHLYPDNPLNPPDSTTQSKIPPKTHHPPPKQTETQDTICRGEGFRDPHTGWLNAQCQGPLCAKPPPLGTARRLQRFLYPISCPGKHYQAPCKSAATPTEEESFHLEDFPSVCFITSIYRQYVLPRDY